MWAAILKSVLGIASAITGYMEKKQMLDAGTALALKENYADAIQKINVAEAARVSAGTDDADSVLKDPNNRG